MCKGMKEEKTRFSWAWRTDPECSWNTGFLSTGWAMTGLVLYEVLDLFLEGLGGC